MYLLDVALNIPSLFKCFKKIFRFTDLIEKKTDVEMELTF